MSGVNFELFAHAIRLPCQDQILFNFVTAHKCIFCKPFNNTVVSNAVLFKMLMIILKCCGIVFSAVSNGILKLSSMG